MSNSGNKLSLDISNNKEEIAPVYLISSERSGSNFLRHRFTEFQNVYFGPSPAHFLKNLSMREPFYGPLDNDQNFLNLITDALNLCYIHFSPWEVKLNKNEVLEEFSSTYDLRNIVFLSDFLMKKYAEKKKYVSFFCKDNHIFDFAWQILYFIPYAKFIYLHRDPRDYVLSQLKRPFFTDSVYTSATLWLSEQLKSLSVMQNLDKNQIIKTSYENLIENEHLEIEKLCNFFDVPFLSKKQSITIDLGQIEEWKNLGKETLKNNMNKYLDELNRKQIDMIESVCWDVMIELGYIPVNKSRPKEISQFDKYKDITFGQIKNKLRGRGKKKDPKNQARFERKRLLANLRNLPNQDRRQSP